MIKENFIRASKKILNDYYLLIYIYMHYIYIHLFFPDANFASVKITYWLTKGSYLRKINLDPTFLKYIE